jgi:hypothetical protein
MSFRSQILILSVSFLVGAALAGIFIFPAFVAIYFMYGP